RFAAGFRQRASHQGRDGARWGQGPDGPDSKDESAPEPIVGTEATAGSRGYAMPGTAPFGGPPAIAGDDAPSEIALPTMSIIPAKRSVSKTKLIAVTCSDTPRATKNWGT